MPAAVRSEPSGFRRFPSQSRYMSVITSMYDRFPDSSSKITSAQAQDRWLRRWKSLRNDFAPGPEAPHQNTSSHFAYAEEQPVVGVEVLGRGRGSGRAAPHLNGWRRRPFLVRMPTDWRKAACLREITAAPIHRRQYGLKREPRWNAWAIVLQKSSTAIAGFSIGEDGWDNSKPRAPGWFGQLFQKPSPGASSPMSHTCPASGLQTLQTTA